jgi:sterol desaturase/sphingolipid hydroxylase (fatty acid hydroxylase superfamily)
MFMTDAASHARIIIFLSVLLGMALWEWLWPKRVQTLSKPFRWTNNLALVVLNNMLIRFILPLTAISVAEYAGVHNLGLFNQLHMPYLVQLILAIVALDAVIYAQHVVFHKVPILWKLHRVHHSDPEIDASTAIRFHTIEIFISMGIKFAAILVLGASPMAVFLFEIILNCGAVFNHSNVAMPGVIDRFLRLFIVTPDMHRVHHSIIPKELNANFGFNLPWWDYLFRTYIAQPKEGHQGMSIGLSQFREKSDQIVLNLLTQPFKNKG